MKIGIIAGESFFKTSSYYIIRLAIEEILQERPETIFYIFDKMDEVENLILPSNTVLIPVPQILKGVLKPGLIQKQKLNAQIKKYEIKKLFVFHPDDLLNTTVHQTLILNNEHPTGVDAMRPFEKANRIISFSKTHQDKLLKLLPGTESLLFQTQPVIQQTFQPLSYDERLTARETFADGKGYFVFADFELTSEGVVNVLKAFSGFKKMQQSNWKMVICIRGEYSVKEKDDLLQPLSSFKFRNDVVVMNSQSESDLAECIAGAYAMISLSGKSLFPLPVLEGLLCHVPVISLQSADIDAYKNALVISNESDPEQLAQKMMALYKDESLKNWLSKKSGQVTSGFNAEENIKAFTKLLL